ncbi:hypothetical protein ASE63_25095 [Bosea sp. Root381]|nr:hypothetical protein ASE63_25095 [Bosea sp. Root381]
MTARHQHLYDHHHLLDGFHHPDSQNRDTAAMQIKLDELIIRLEGAREELLDLEELDEEDLVVIRRDFCKRASKARRAAEEGSSGST